MPRPFSEYPRRNENFDFARLPIPWINWASVANAEGDDKKWTPFDDRALVTLDESDYTLCAICGEELTQNKVFGLLGTKHEEGELFTTSGSAMHPRCAVLSSQYCPHFREVIENGEDCFALYQGEGLGFDFDDVDPWVPPGFPNEGESDSDLKPDLSEFNISPEARLVSISALKELTRQDKEDAVVSSDSD